jgi:hypothetical protein
MARWLTIAFALIFSIPVTGQTIHSTRDGAWQDSTIWEWGRLPQPGDTIFVDHIVSSDQSLHIDSTCYLHITANGTLCMPEDSLFFKCGSFLRNGGMISVYYIHVHDGISNSCLWFYHFHADSCYAPVLFHIDGTHCGTPLCPLPPTRPAAIDTLFYPRVTVTVFPNPTMGDVSVRIIPAAPPTGEERFTFALYDLLGKHLVEHSDLIMGDNPMILPHNLAKGAYLWHVYPHRGAINQLSTGVLLIK